MNDADRAGDGNTAGGGHVDLKPETEFTIPQNGSFLVKITFFFFIMQRVFNGLGVAGAVL